MLQLLAHGPHFEMHLVSGKGAGTDKIPEFSSRPGSRGAAVLPWPQLP